MSRVATVTAELELRLVVADGPTLPVLADVRYEADDPWAVRVAFHTGGTDVVEWMFARQLLTDGLAGPVGEGDVRVWPSVSESEEVVSLAMTSPSGSALFEIDRTALAQLLERTYLLVPVGAEGDCVDLDAELAVLRGQR